VRLDGSSDFAISWLNLPVTNVLAGDASGPQVSRFHAPGTIFGVLVGGVGRRIPRQVHGTFKLLFNAGGGSMNGAGRV
jgi:hypothetical protein